MIAAGTLERRRLAVQHRLDAGRAPAERNRRGQFATPAALAVEMLEVAAAHAPPRPLRVLDPALGTGVFYSAALRVLGAARLRSALGFEIDAAVAKEAGTLWAPRGLAVRRGDFCAAPPRRGWADLVVCNPPYVRHHHLAPARKRRLRRRAAALGFDVGGLAGLYVHFLLLADPWLAPGGVGVWIVPSEFLDAAYGRPLRAYLAQRVELLRLHRFDADRSRFADALVSSLILVFRKAAPRQSRPLATAGDALRAAARRRRVERGRLLPAARWSGLWEPPAAEPSGPRLGDLFTVRRGIATGANDYFVLEAREARRLGLPRRFLRPLLPGPRLVPGDVVERGPGGFPAGLPARVLLDCPLDAAEVRRRHPALRRYLELGRRRGVPSRYLPRHRRPWYAQERRAPAPILCTYMGRCTGGRFLRFVRNRSDATATNVWHLLYPGDSLAAAASRRPELLDEAFAALRAAAGGLAPAGRRYGGGLVKIEPGALAALPLNRPIQW